MCEVDGWESCNVPLMLHGDAVPCVAVGKANSKSFDVYSVQGLFSSGPTKEVKLYIFGLFELSKTDGAAGATMWNIWRVVLWSLHFLALGIWPTVDHDGQPYEKGCLQKGRAGKPLAGGLKAVVWLLKGDIEHCSKAYGLNHHSSNEPCPFCPANRDETNVGMLFNNFRKNALACFGYRQEMDKTSTTGPPVGR